MNTDNSNPSQMLSPANLAAEANRVCNGTGIIFAAEHNKVTFQVQGEDSAKWAKCVLKAHARVLRKEAQTYDGYVAGKGLVAQQFEILASQVA